MSRDDLNNLCLLLDELKKCLPCKGGLCMGHQHCEFGENGCYGESCAIEDVTNAISYYLPDILASCEKRGNNGFGSTGR